MDKDYKFTEPELQRAAEALAKASRSLNDALPTLDQAGKHFLGLGKTLRKAEAEERARNQGLE